MFFYAEHNNYGIDTMTQDNKGRIVSAGSLYRFATRALRDAWIDADEWNGNYHRSAITRREAEKYHPGAFRDTAYASPVWEMDEDGDCQFIGSF